MAENYNGMAVGIFARLDSFAACFVALDAASKAANVKIQNIERNRLVTITCHKMWFLFPCNRCNGSSQSMSYNSLQSCLLVIAYQLVIPVICMTLP